MFGRRKVPVPIPAVPKTPLIELQECIQTLKDLISLTKEELKLTPNPSKPQRIDNDAQFIILGTDIEDHMVEVIRRIAEIVVQGEQKASIKILNEGGTDDNTNGEEDVHENHVFDYFCEKNVVGAIINVATGAAFVDHPIANNLESSPSGALEFASSTDTVVNGASDRNLRTFDHPVQLPPLSVAIQAIQSVSILIQNVKMTTSLYYLLSNNKVNDLINLPLQLYACAETHFQEEQSIAASSSRTETQSSHEMGKIIADTSELTNIFVAFLKSLAMKMNPETLQFYISYPAQSVSSEDMDFGAIQFPLYERALQFCTPDEDPFVRVTAMNLCLNTLRLATNGDEIINNEASENEEDSKINRDREKKKRPDKRKNPSEMSSLPFRERLAISHFVCAPMRVQGLCAGIFTTLATLCGKVEEAMRSMERIDRAISAKFLNIDNHSKTSASVKDGTSKLVEEEKKDIEKLQSRRAKVMMRFLGDVVSDFQDEMYLLEDMLNVGLVPLNEQIIEMMFPTVIYPLILTPLHNFIKRASSGDERKTENNPFGPKPLAKHFSRPISRGGGISASECDSSLAKSALFVIASIYHFISHKVLLHLLLTALWHPLAPDVTSAATITQKSPDILYYDEEGNALIKTDKIRATRSSLYKFGCSSSKGEGRGGYKRGDIQNDCVFVFAPILSEIFECSTNGKRPASLPENLARNRYRRTLLSCLSGTDGMGELQSLAVYAVDAMLSTVEREVLNNVMFASKIHGKIEFRSSSPSFNDDDESVESDAAFSTSVASTVHSVSTSNHMLEFIACMSVTIITATISYDGLWSLKYNPVAAHAIYSASMIDSKVKDTAVKFIRHRRSQSGKFVAQTPSRLEKYGQSDEKEIDADLKMDRVFFEAFCDGDTYIAENTIRNQDHPVTFWDGPALIPVAKDGSMLDLAKQICKDISAKHIIGHDCEEAAYRCGANSALSHIQLDAFAKLLKNVTNSPPLRNKTGYLSVATQSQWSQSSMPITKNGQRILISPLSEKFCTLLFDEELPSTSNSNGPPIIHKAGDVIKLVGRKPFPCVCEINDESQSLVTNKAACVIADGVKWQSLYLIMLNKQMILTEPVDGDSGGYGRVITSCPLSCLMAETYDLHDTDQHSPAQRLLLTHFSPERQVPGLFVADNKIDSTSPPNEVRISRSCLDIWFEDSNSGAKAHKALSHRIFKARTERGKKIRETLPRP